MRKQIIILLSLLLAGIGFVAWRAARSNAFNPKRPTVTFAGREPVHLQRTAVFYVTNREPQEIMIESVEVELFIEGKWVSSFGRGGAEITFQNIIEPGGRTKIFVKHQEDHPWRIQIYYQQETKGLKDLLRRAREAWRDRSWFQLKRQEWNTDQITSSEISN
ncbi:MAG: hypothetical protein HY043_11300 [Verrucomicrobia bacterium]|nr:hypothetical protein [Verrucomicrobiota bacterium]